MIRILISFLDVFKKQFAALNPGHDGEAKGFLRHVCQEMDNDDLGRSFHKRLLRVSPLRLVYFENSKNNLFHCTAEFTCKRDQDEFRPDIVLFVNGLPLAFLEVKKPNNHGGTVICETSKQARKIYTYFDEIQRDLNEDSSVKTHFCVGLIFHDSKDKETRKKIVKDFKKNMTIDILVVFNTLLTGFDAPCLKSLSFGRKLKDHNLLQVITRVNRPYKDNRYGYDIDFADIKRNFAKTNDAYLHELNRFNASAEVGEKM